MKKTVEGFNEKLWNSAGSIGNLLISEVHTLSAMTKPQFSQSLKQHES